MFYLINFAVTNNSFIINIINYYYIISLKEHNPKVLHL